jgi:hypothetical protein
VQECVIEFESVRGGKVRIQWKASAAPDWTSLLRAWRETENRNGVSDLAADAGAGGHRAGRWKKRHRLSSAALPGETGRGSFFRLCV